MANGQKKKALKVRLATSMTLVSLSSVFMATTAWFSANRAVKRNAGPFQASKIAPIIKKAEVYEQAADKGRYHFNSEPIAMFSFEDNLNIKGDKSLTLKTYDPRQSQPDATRLYLFTVNQDIIQADSHLDFQIISSTSEDPDIGGNSTGGSLVLLDKSNKPVHEVQTDNNSQSSILSFQRKNFDSDEKPDVSDRSSIYSSTDSASFVSSSVEVVNEIKRTTFHYASTSLEVFKHEKNSSGRFPNYIGVVCHYNLAAIQYIFSINLGNNNLNEDTIHFSCDWYFDRKF